MQDLVGYNGGGKTSLQKLIPGLYKPQSCQILILRQSLKK
ncbi:MAG: ATP-binding cassette domain-containing protein [gamma proteobacterium symbiont of Taylorina sp.]|nr:ATP-binding cassette domain-containing protein [gamma proteobacterium symbiont of Taylorina sp.]